LYQKIISGELPTEPTEQDDLDNLSEDEFEKVIAEETEENSVDDDI
jgi:hypothetical protein